MRGDNDAEKPAAGGEPGCPIAIGQQAVTTNVLETGGQHMQQEAPDELVGCQRHGLVCGAVLVILPLKRDIVAALVEGDRAAVHSRLKVRFVPKDIVFTSDVLDTFRFEDGKIIELVEFVDTALIKSVVGA